jgi:hypothetical protein
MMASLNEKENLRQQEMEMEMTIKEVENKIFAGRSGAFMSHLIK